MFQVKIGNNANLILIWPHRHFQQNLKVPFCQKNTGVEALKMRYRYPVIGFVCGSSTGNWSPEKCVRPQFVNTLFIVRLRSNMSTRRTVIINY